MSDSNNNHTAAAGGLSDGSTFYSAASTDNDDNDGEQNQPSQEEEVVIERINFEGNRRPEYRRRLTLDPLTDFIVNGDVLLGDGADSDADSNDDDNNNLHQLNQFAAQQPAEGDSENDAVRQQLLLFLGQGMMNNDAGSSSDEDGYDQLNQLSGDNDGNNVHEDVPNLMARDHSYLPTAQPLYPEGWIPAGRHRTRGQHQQNAECEDNTTKSLNEVASTCIRSNQYVGANKSPTHYEIAEPPAEHMLCAPTKLPIHADEKLNVVQSTENILAVMEVDDVVLFPGSVIPLRIRDPIWINYLGALIDDARGLYGSHSGSSRGMGEVTLGILPRIANRTRRRARSSSVPSDTGSRRMGRWRIDLIRRGVASARSSGSRASNDRSRMRTDDSNNENDSEGISPSNVRGGGSASAGERDEADEESNGEVEYFQPLTSTHSSTNPYIGKVGTLATITFTHEEAAVSFEQTTDSNNSQERSNSRLWQRRRGELVFSAMGTKRFRIVAPIDTDEKPEYQDKRYEGILFEVEEMNHLGPQIPPTWILRSPGDFRYPVVTQSNSHANALWHLSQRSSLPVASYQTVWPWRIAQRICTLIQQTEHFQGIKKILPSAGGLIELKDTFRGADKFRVVDPSAFADWLSSNLPLSQNERLDLLEMECRVTQLKFLLKNIEKDRDTILRCKCCASALSLMRNIFTVKGAEGTTGQYVNEHGIVHQTLTLRDVDPKVSVVCVGRPETKDSWFPGYSWQIAYCYVCSSHLGWKFRQVSKQDGNDDPDRPPKFWGFSCSSITTESFVAPRRVVFSRD